MMESCAVQLYPTQDVRHSFVQCILLISHFVALSLIRSTVTELHYRITELEFAQL